MSSKGKGNSFEWQVARQLSKWLTNGRDSKQLIRSVQSGGWHLRGAKQLGDLAPNGPQGERFREHFAVETKHHRAIDLWQIWTRETADHNTIRGWWLRLLEEISSRELDKPPAPLLIIRQNYRPILVGLPDLLVEHASTIELLTSTIRVRTEQPPNIHLFPLDVFLLKSPEFWYDCCGRFCMMTLIGSQSTTIDFEDYLENRDPCFGHYSHEDPECSKCLAPVIWQDKLFLTQELCAARTLTKQPQRLAIRNLSSQEVLDLLQAGRSPHEIFREIIGERDLELTAQDARQLLYVRLHYLREKKGLKALVPSCPPKAELMSYVRNHQDS